MSEYHKNIFNHYSESDSSVIIENNLTRALSIVLESDPLVRDHFLRLIIDKYDEQTISDDAIFSIQIQEDASSIEPLSRVFAVSLTTTNFDNNDYQQATCSSIKTQICDMVISYSDCIIIIEVKRTGENCLSQLKTQLSKVNSIKNSQIAYKSITWGKIIAVIDDCTSKRNSSSNPIPRITQDFLDFLKSRFPEWIEAKALSRISKITKTNKNQIQKRLDKLKYFIGDELGIQLNTIGGRLSIPLSGWNVASEVNLRLDDTINSIKVGIWPGDTKQQGWHLWCNNGWKRWIRDTQEEINNFTFSVHTKPYIKFSHFNQGIDWFTIPTSKLEVLGEDLFRKLSGQKKRTDWDAFELEMEKYFPDWKCECEWESQFAKSNRNYVNIAIGVEYEIIMPFDTVSKLDSDENNGGPFVSLIKNTLDILKTKMTRN